MGHTNDRSTKASSLVNPTSLNLQPRPFAPLESDEKEEAVSRKSGYSENFLEKIINTPSSESATPVQRKSGNRLKAIAAERANAALQNQSIQRQEAVEEEKSEGEQKDGKEFTMNPEPPPVQRKFENRLRAKNAQKMAIQAKLAIGEPNDKYEQEADATAARVVQQINSPMTSQDQPVQRKFENQLRAKNAQKMAIQAKLAIGEPNDKYEQEADATAARVVQQINSSIPSQSQPIQRQEMEADEELQMKPLVQRSENLGGGEASTDLESAIQSARGSGQSLDANLQQSMGQAMGADFSGVKVHTDSQSDQLNKSIQAKAFTTGQDLFFRQGAYEPSSRGGQELIAHELTHVVQQNGGAVQRSLPKTDSGMSVVQREWVEDGGSQMWDQLIDGVTWFAKGPQVMWFNITDASEIKQGEEESYRLLEGQKKSFKQWQSLGLNPAGSKSKEEDNSDRNFQKKRGLADRDLEKSADEVANEKIARVMRSAEAEHFRLASVGIIKYCTTIDDLIAVLNEKELDVSTWKTRVQAFSAAQVLLGSAMAAVGIAACVVTLGAAAVPLSIALSVAVGAAGIGSGVSKAGLGKTGKKKAGAVETVKTVAVPGAKQGFLEGVGALAGSAAQETTKLVIGPAGGAITVGMGAKSLYDMSNVDPKAVYSELEFDKLNTWLISASIKMHTYYADHKAELNKQLFELVGQKILDTITKLNTYKG